MHLWIVSAAMVGPSSRTIQIYSACWIATWWVARGAFFATWIPLVGFAADHTRPTDDLPEGVVNTQNPQDISLTPQQSLNRIRTPQGFQVTLFAGEPDLRRPIAFDFDDRGRLWVVENYSHPVLDPKSTRDRVVILEDTDHDGQFDRRKVFWDQGRFLTAIAVGHGGVWLGNTPDLTFIPDADQDGTPDGDAIAVLDGFRDHDGNNNNLNNFHWGPDGWLYGAIGIAAKSFVGKPATPQPQRTVITRGLWRVHPVTHAFEVVANGMVNPWGADFSEVGDHFTVNTTTAHLWHIVPGAYCQRRAGEADNRFAYARIQGINDHLHWGGGPWHSSRQTTESHSVAGGGHAHCGAMIYYGDNWPEKYRGTLFTYNLHGNRINNDVLVAKKSSYVANHSEDFLWAHDPWFRGLSIKYGPDGGVFVSDWHEIGECHDIDGSHRTSGRMYKITYGSPAGCDVDLRAETSAELAARHQQKNEWFVRHARRILHERAVAGEDLQTATEILSRQFRATGDAILQLQALWTLHLMGNLDDSRRIGLLKHDNEHVRRWAVRMLVDQQVPGSAAMSAMERRARVETSPKARLALAVALGRVGLDERWGLAEALVTHAEDTDEPLIPLITWYGVEPLVHYNRERSLQLAAQSQIPLIRQFIARRAVDVVSPDLDAIVAAALELDKIDARFDILRGMLQALADKDISTAPAQWKKLYDQVATVENSEYRSIAIRLATLFGDQTARAQLMKSVMRNDLPSAQRRASLQALLQLKDGISVESLHVLSRQDSELRLDAIRALALNNDDSTSAFLLNHYRELDDSCKQAAMSVLTSRQDFAEQLVIAIARGVVAQEDVSLFCLEQLRSFPGRKLKDQVHKLWSTDYHTPKKSDQIARYLKKMDAEYLANGSALAGRALFHKTCARCHRLFGEGGIIGPDLTGSGRAKTNYIVTNLVDPNAAVDPAYRLTRVMTNTGRLFSGVIVQQDDNSIVLRTPDADIRLKMQNVEQVMTSTKSMMPEGMLQTLTDPEVRDLLLYLASPEQVKSQQRKFPED
ncbi:MAG: c-type cytochrome [Pirellulales bacterium]|nr:c-type cytochrome [Pirellulales bacterium]